MDKVDSLAGTEAKPALDMLREQDSCISFTEHPSDKYDHVRSKLIDKNTGRIKSHELFLLFTADIIKQKVLFTR